MGISNWPKLAWSCVLMLSLASLVLAILCFCCKVSYKLITVKRDINIIVSKILYLLGDLIIPVQRYIDCSYCNP